MEPMFHLRNGGFGALMLRRTMPEVFQKDGLWDNAETIYPWFGGESTATVWRFPSGATVEYSSIENSDDWRKYLGSQYALICFDQLETFLEKQFWAMLGCLRSMSGVRPYVRATANPEPGWLADFISWWWDEETGYPIPERSGVVRFFARIKDAVHWADTREELVSKYPGCLPLSFTFIAAFVEDNPILLEQNPQYLANLKNQGIVEQERWLKGNWKIKMAGGLLLRSSWFTRVVNERPARFDRLMRFWDLAATEERAGKSVAEQPCFTAGALIGLVDGTWYICDIEAFRKTPFEGEVRIKQVAASDPLNAEVRIEQEGGSGGKYTISHFQHAMPGYDVGAGTDKWQKKAKVERCKFTLASAAQSGNVVLVRGPWIKEFLEDCDLAPDGFMDRIDAVSGAMIEMRDSVHAPPPQRKRVGDDDDGRIVGSNRPRGILV